MQAGSVLLVVEISLGLAVLDPGTVDLGGKGDVELVVVGGDDAQKPLGFSGWLWGYLL